MRKSLKKAGVGIVSTAMLAGMMTIPAFADNTTITVAIPQIYDATDVQLVQDAMNKILEERYSLDIQLMMIPMGNWQQQSNLLLTGNEVDVIAGFQTPLVTYVENGQFLNLDEYVANASDDFKSIWSDEELAGTSVDGSIYSIPNLRNFGNYFGLDIDVEAAEKYGIEAGQKLTMDDITEFLAWAKENYPDRYAIVPQSGSTMANGWSWDGLGDTKYLGVSVDCGQSETIENLFETDDFVDFCTYTRGWYEAGYIMPDALSNTESGMSLVQGGKAVCYFDNYANQAPPTGLIYTVVLEPWAESNSYAALSYGINTMSSHPDEAWTMLQALYTDADVSTLLCDGIEGTHYTLNDDGTASFPEGKTGMDNGWGLLAGYWIPPYSGNTIPLDENGPTYFADLIDFNNSCLKSIATGVSFTTDGIKDQYSACSNIRDKYYDALMCGTVDVESTIKQANEELYAAGLQDVIDAKQAQLDEFLASQPDSGLTEDEEATTTAE